MLTLQQGLGNQYFCNYLEGFMTGLDYDTAQIDPQGGPTNTTDNQWVNYSGGSLKIAGVLDPNIPVDWYFDVNQGSSYDPNPYDPFVVAFNNGITDNSCAQLPATIDPQVSILRLINDSAYADHLFEKKLFDRKVAYGILKDSLQLLFQGSIYDVELQNFFNVYALSNQGYLKDIEDLLINNDFAQAAILNIGLVPANLHESNSVKVNQVVIESSGDSIAYTSVQRQELLAIAYQNPVIGGEAVYRARAILRLDLEDMPIGFRISGNNAHDRPIRIWPNPTTGQLYISTSVVNEEGYVLSVYSTIGEEVVSTRVLSNVTTDKIQLDNLPGGIYLLRLISGTQLHSERILLIR